MVWLNGYLIKRVLKSKYGMTMLDLRKSIVGRIKEYECWIPRYEVKGAEKT